MWEGIEFPMGGEAAVECGSLLPLLSSEPDKDWLGPRWSPISSRRERESARKLAHVPLAVSLVLWGSKGITMAKPQSASKLAHSKALRALSFRKDALRARGKTY
jgi:hypothetical protein